MNKKFCHLKFPAPRLSAQVIRGEFVFTFFALVISSLLGNWFFLKAPVFKQRSPLIKNFLKNFAK